MDGHPHPDRNPEIGLFERSLRVGCGGDRDRGKRPQMGAIATRLADKTFVTSDNPRTEDPEKILKDIRPGLAKDAEWTSDPDRRAAIFAAIGEAEAGDTVVIAGKGHEDYQILPTGKIHFDDREVARVLRALPDRRYRSEDEVIEAIRAVYISGGVAEDDLPV